MSFALIAGARRAGKRCLARADHLGCLPGAVRAPRPAASWWNDLEGRCGAAGLPEPVAVGEVVGLSMRGEVLVDGIVQPVGRVRRVAHVDGGDFGKGWIVVEAMWCACREGKC